MASPRSAVWPGPEIPPPQGWAREAMIPRGAGRPRERPEQKLQWVPLVLFQAIGELSSLLVGAISSTSL
eukprot:7190974-Pyramimonas_sp.AAC.1